MRLLVEINESVTTVSESLENGQKQLYIEGVFAQAEKKNRNGRIYPKRILEGQINKYIEEKVKTNRALGELTHPANRPNVDPKEVSHRIVEMSWDKNDVYGKALVLNTPNGNIVRGLLEGGTKIGIDSWCWFCAHGWWYQRSSKRLHHDRCRRCYRPFWY